MRRARAGALAITGGLYGHILIAYVVCTCLLNNIRKNIMKYKNSITMVLLLSTTPLISIAGEYTMAPDGSYVSGDSFTMAPDGSYVGGDSSTIAPDGSYVSGDRSTMAPDGSYVSGDRSTMAPDGSYVSGDRPTMTPDGSYIGD